MEEKGRLDAEMELKWVRLGVKPGAEIGVPLSLATCCNRGPVERHVKDKDSEVKYFVDFARLLCPNEHLQEHDFDDLLIACSANSRPVKFNANGCQGEQESFEWFKGMMDDIVEHDHNVPIFDGSAREWVEAIEQVGLTVAMDSIARSWDKLAPYFTQLVHVSKGDSLIAAFPSKETNISYEINFPQVPAIGLQ
nr:probable UDP-3-O-acyl-N-acetylglucosamine deacetylase 2 [Tanacetum cinerariifolium]